MTSVDRPGEGGAPAPPPLAVLLVADDLLFPSRVREALKPLGVGLRVASHDPASVRAALNDGTAPAPSAILVNLNVRRGGPDPLGVIHDLKSDPKTASIPLMAFAGHVERDKHEAARQAGADLVAANSSVSMHLPRLLERLLAGPAAPAGAPDAAPELL
jgi:CheY-like chemotaxis protein